MQYEEFLAVVQEKGNIQTERETLIAVEATLKTLGERLTEAQAAVLALQLPFEIGLFLTVVDTNKDFGRESFYRHVARREGLPLEESIPHARAVLSTLRDVLEPDLLREAMASLPDDNVSGGVEGFNP